MARRLNPVAAVAQPVATAEPSRRLAALIPYAILDTLPEPEFDEVAALAAAICGTSASAISFVCVDRQWFKAEVGLNARETPIEQSFCAHALARGTPDLFEVPDATLDSRFADNPLVTGAPGIRYYGGIPLFGRDGTGLGTLCVIDDKPRAGLDALQHQTLRTLASQVTAQLELRRTIAERDAHAQAQQTSARELEWLATHDPLTGLANRTLFQSRLQEAISTDACKNRTALMVLDVDHFKQVNDTLGHDAGDRLLIAVGERLQAATRSTDTVARLGGDEFGILLCGIDTALDIERVTRSIFARLQEPIAYRDRLIEVRLTIGAAIFPDHAVTAADLIQHADVALYSAKAAGRGQAAIFDPAMLVAAQQHAAMMSHARSALASGDIVPFYQPKIDLVTRRVTGFEALLRLRRASGGVDPAAAIAGAFGDRELATRLGSVMIAQVAADMRRWLDQGLDFGRIALNGSASEFRDDGYADRILAALAAAGVPADRLELEVTESVLLDRDALAVERALTTLTAAGVRIALDDFGTGYASLSHLNRFPVHVLKIDRSFVSGIEEDAGKRAIVNAILNMAENLGINTVAEGIETLAQAECLRAAGCRTGQGYLFAHAQPAERVPALVAGGSPATLCLAA
jgi:diguanylate cyclase (GGDEF)-like protein